jgi:hypothetical protein
MALGVQISQVVIEFVVPQNAPGPTPTPFCNNPLAGTVGVGYTHTFTVAGGTPPYTWAIIAGAVPGLILDPSTGIYAGTPTTAGAFPLTIQVTDSLGAVGTVDCSITINAAPVTTGSIRITLRGVKLRPVCDSGEVEIGQVPEISKVDRAL